MFVADKAPDSRAPLDAWLRWQEALHPRPIALGLERVRDVAGRLGLPVPVKTLTVAGTNGKGSTTHLLSEIYRAAGYRVGRYTSPHLTRYNERVAVDGVPLADAELVRGFAAVESARAGVPLTYFEFGTLAALWLFAEARLDVQVLEVGLGGRLDAVNVVDADCAVITSIGIDHVEYLGPTREHIGREKAGVLRRGGLAVCVDPDPPQAIAQAAAEAGADLWQLDRDFRYQRAGDAWNWFGPGGNYKKLPEPALAGAVQLRNAAGAVAAVTRLQGVLPVPETAIRAGLVRLRLPGRFECRGDMVLDVAHNVEAARVLADNLRSLKPGPVRIVIGMLSDKPVEEFARELAPLATRFYAGGLPSPRGIDAAALGVRLRRAGASVEVLPDVPTAFARARAERQPGETIVVCGSFLTVAAVTGMLDG